MKHLWAAKKKADGREYGKAHYLDGTGQPVCADALAPFLCTWVPLDEAERAQRHHLCGICKQRLRSPRKCRCGGCSPGL
jgi:hypothetical protein